VQTVARHAGYDPVMLFEFIAFLVPESVIPWTPSFWEDPASPRQRRCCLFVSIVCLFLPLLFFASVPALVCMGRAGIQPFFKAFSHFSAIFQSNSDIFDSERVRPLSDETARGRAKERVPAPGPYMYYMSARHGTNSRASFVRRNLPIPS
jgi:hypothetical protein